MKTIKMLKPDAKGRIALGHLADGISRFAMCIDKQDRIILVPYVEIPAEEKWLFENKRTLAHVKQGLKDSAEGRLVNKGSFSQYTKKEK